MPNASFLSNPVSLLDINSNTRTDRMLGNIFLTWEIIEGLRLKGIIGADINYSQGNSYIPSTTVAGASEMVRLLKCFVQKMIIKLNYWLLIIKQLKKNMNWG